MPAENLGHDRDARPAVALRPTLHWLEDWRLSPSGINIGFIVTLTKPVSVLFTLVCLLTETCFKLLIPANLSALEKDKYLSW